MHKEVLIEIDHETLMKLDQLAAEQGTTRDALISESLKAELDALEPVNA
jgi:predicted transcriptional regulator